MEDFITGYQYGEKGEYRGEYRFPNNLDKEEVHVPPFTTLIAPPVDIQPGYCAVWSGEVWNVVIDDNITAIKPTDVSDKLDYSQLMPEFIEEMTEMGLWTPKMQELYSTAQAENERLRQEVEAAAAQQTLIDHVPASEIQETAQSNNTVAN